MTTHVIYTIGYTKCTQNLKIIPYQGGKLPTHKGWEKLNDLETGHWIIHTTETQVKRLSPACVTIMAADDECVSKMNE
jgi:hypothetical protein